MTLDATIYQPVIREIRGASTIIVELGDVRIADDLEGLREFAADLTRRLEDLAEIRRIAAQRPDRDHVEMDPKEIAIGQEVFTHRYGWVRTIDTGKGTCHRWDLMGDSEVLTSRGTVYFKAGEKALVAVPECDGAGVVSCADCLTELVECRCGELVPAGEGHPGCAKGAWFCYWMCACGHCTRHHNRWWEIDDGNGRYDSGSGCDRCGCPDMEVAR